MGMYVVTQFVNQFIDIDAGNVMRAIFKKLGIKKEDYGKDPYDLYVNDVHGRIKFKTSRPNYHLEKNKTQTNLNYFQFNETLEALSKMLSPLTNPVLPPVHVLGVLERLDNHIFTPSESCYKPIGTDDLKEHSYRIVKKIVFSKKSELLEQIKKYCEVQRQVLYQKVLETVEYDADDKEPEMLMLMWILKDNGLKGQEARDEADRVQILPLNDELTRKVLKSVGDFVDINENHKRLNLDNGMVLIMQYGLEQGHFLKHDSDEQYWREKINAFTKKADLERVKDQIRVVEYVEKRAGVCISPLAYRLFDPDLVTKAYMQATVSGTFPSQKYVTGRAHKDYTTILNTIDVTPEMIADEIREHDDNCGLGATKRSEGIAFIMRTIASDVSDCFVADISPSKRPRIPVLAIRDLDKESAIRQHVAACAPIEEAVRTPKFLEKTYYRNIQNDVVKTRDYPEDWIEEFKDCQKKWELENLVAKN